MSSTFIFSPSCPAVARQFGYFNVEPQPVFAWQHFSTASITRKMIVILCNPMGHEYTHSHRSFQHWADQLADVGCLVIRFDYSGTGDSSGREIPDNLMPVWLANIMGIAEQARATYPDYQLCIAGLRLGGMLAYLAAQKLNAEQLVLWEPIVQGRRYLRELQALSKFSIDSDEADENYTEFAGFLMSNATAEALKSVNLMDIPLNPTTKILCLYRDDASQNENFNHWLQTQNSSVEIQCPPGYEDMLALPHETIVPFQAIAAIVNWLKQDSMVSSETLQPLAQLPEITLENGIQEQGLWYDEQQHLFGILTRPKKWDVVRPLVILLNSGSVHHVGPNRVYTHLARTIAEAGLACVRLDIAGLGDSFKPDSVQENHPFPSTAQNNLATAISHFKNFGIAQHFIVSGICSGAHAAFHGALQLGATDNDALKTNVNIIREVILINPLTFYWQDGMSLSIPDDIQIAHDSVYYSSSMRDPKKWLKFLTGKASTGYIVKFMTKRLAERMQVLFKNMHEVVFDKHSPLSADLLRITRANIPISFLISASDPGLEIIKAQAKRTLKKGQASGDIRVKIFAGANHTFSRLKHRNDLLRYIREKFTKDFQ